MRVWGSTCDTTVMAPQMHVPCKLLDTLNQHSQRREGSHQLVVSKSSWTLATLYVATFQKVPKAPAAEQYSL